MNSIIDMHLDSAQYAEKRSYRLGHCQVVSWLLDNFRAIKANEVTYKDYEGYVRGHGLNYFNEESFNIFKEGEYV